MSKPLKYLGVSVVFQEVPDEISLAFNISGCPHRCPDCHSKYLWEDYGKILRNHFEEELKRYLPNITCVCFMGGDQNQRELIALCRRAHSMGVKTCLYTGCDSAYDISPFLLEQLDYIKIGSYREDRGPLSSPNTNQRMFRMFADGHSRAVFDITPRFFTERM